MIRLHIANTVVADSGPSLMDVGGVKAGGSIVKSGGSNWRAAQGCSQRCLGDGRSQDRGGEGQGGDDDERNDEGAYQVHDTCHNCVGAGAGRGRPIGHMIRSVGCLIRCYTLYKFVVSLYIFMGLYMLYMF